MNKLELISALKTEANISKTEAARVIQLFFDKMTDAMADVIPTNNAMRVPQIRRLSTSCPNWLVPSRKLLLV